MRISHKRKKEDLKKQYFFNEEITAPEVLVLGAEGEKLGVMKTAEAIRLAREQELDLVEINPKVDPPVVKIMNFGQFRYAQEKEQRIRKAHQHVVETKCIRLTLRIGEHDKEIRKIQTLKFLDNGDKVKIEVVMRGREMQQGPMAFELLKKFILDVSVVAPVRFDQNTERQGNKVTAVIAKS
ncbi:MAG: translation initiation factor IF-3 [bacterium]|nr:translation initiation factor IF-3 [bacterium]